nr:MAG TPA: hypothetical protein [Bacteriophage sp.]
MHPEVCPVLLRFGSGCCLAHATNPRLPYSLASRDLRVLLEFPPRCPFAGMVIIYHLAGFTSTV